MSLDDDVKKVCYANRSLSGNHSLSPEQKKTLNEVNVAYYTTLADRVAVLALKPETVAYIHNLLSLSLSELGRLDESVFHSKIAHTLVPNDPDFNFNLGTFFVRLGLFDEALPYLEKAVGLAPNVPNNLAELGLALFKSANFTKWLLS